MIQRALLPEAKRDTEAKRDRSDIDKLGNLVHQRAFLRLKAVLGSTHFPRATTGTKGRLQAQSFGDLLLPLWLAERAASLHALAERLQFLVVVRLIDPLDPIRGPIDRPRRQQGPVLRGAVTLSPQTRPSPFLRSKNELSAVRIALNIPRDNPKMLVAFHRERLIPTLVDMPQPRVSPVLLPSPHVGDRQALLKLASSPSCSGQSTRCQWLGISE